ncbi:MAG: 4Fe-4S dicluster domain-containing protein, partial [Clostridia bacterium]|nr:4Fe-4S dicluster domain-containing protein [Clostridia bacterium]
IIDYEKAYQYMVEYTTKTFALKGEKVVQMNIDAITKAIDYLEKIDIPSEWQNLANNNHPNGCGNEYFDKFASPVLKGKGDSLKVSAFSPDGSVPTATTQFEKRGISDKVSSWIKENCIQCNQCAFVCPHACIRPVLLENNDNIPATFEMINAIQPKGQYFRLQISPLDCTGCGSCINVCPAPKKALEYKPLSTQKTAQKENWEFAKNHENSNAVINKKQVKGVGFARQLFEFSGACAGCGETPYVKLATTLFGDSMIIANATGCSSIYGGSAPTCPFAKTNDGKGPAWANSLFEDNAEFGYGISLGANNRRKKLKEIAKKLVENRYENEILTNWLNTFSDKKLTQEDSKILYENIH